MGVVDALPGFDVVAEQLDAVDRREVDVRDRRAVRIHDQPSDGYVLGASSRITVLVSRNGSNPSLPPSRPMPDCLNPPNAMPKSVRNAFCPTVPDRSSRATARARSTSVVNTDALSP